jgi:hypothetical protein
MLTQDEVELAEKEYARWATEDLVKAVREKVGSDPKLEVLLRRLFERDGRNTFRFRIVPLPAGYWDVKIANTVIAHNMPDGLAEAQLLCDRLNNAYGRGGRE